MGFKRIAYGIHSIAPYERGTEKPIGILEVIGGGTLGFNAETESLFGGSNSYSWAVESKNVESEWSATVKEMPDFLFELFMGASVSTTAASATGTVSALTNAKGTLLEAVTGIASIGIKAGSEGDLKTSKYVVVAASATTVDVYALTNIEFKKGVNPLSYINEGLKINLTPLTIVTATAVTIPNTGLELTGGSGTIAMAAGDSAVCNANSAHGGLSTIKIGQASDTFKAHGQICLAQKRSDDSIFEIELFNVLATGFPLPLEEKAFSVIELTMKLIYDSERDIVAEIRTQKGT